MSCYLVDEPQQDLEESDEDEEEEGNPDGLRAVKAGAFEECKLVRSSQPT